MKIRFIEIENFRGIKNLKSKILGNFVCLIGHGDNCKSTIISAIDFTLSTRWNPSFDDSDFYNLSNDNPIVIKITLTDWDEQNESVRRFFSESKFGQFICGLGENGPIAEPPADGPKAISIQLKVDRSLEPEWHVVKGDETKQITSTERTIFGLGRIDTFLDNNFTWGKNSLLTKLSPQNVDNMHSILNDIGRSARNTEFILPGCNEAAETVKSESLKFGVRLNTLLPKVDIQKLSLASGALALHEGSVPLRNLGMGSKKLISCSMQMKVHNGKNITLIDEIELGLEPHRIRGLIKKLKESNQQVITTTHSPVVLRELVVANHELYICKKTQNGTVDLKSLSLVADSQGSVRSNAEAFLGRRIVVCEGPTEIGILRALDSINTNGNTDIPVWTLNTAYFNAGGISNVKQTAISLQELGYDVAILCDNDTPTTFTQIDVQEVTTKGIKVFIWEIENSTEKQLFKDITWSALQDIVATAATAHGEKTQEDLVNSVKSQMRGLSDNILEWQDSEELRKAIGSASGAGNGKAWFKRIDRAEAVFQKAIPNLKPASEMKGTLNQLWRWVQS